jgi:tetratricopeptide (TPR) repeat protein
LRARSSAHEFSALRPEVPNLLGATEFAARHNQNFAVQMLVALLGPFFDASGFYQQAITVTNLAINVGTRIGKRRDPLANMIMLSLTYSRVGDYHQAIKILEQARKMNEEFGLQDHQSSILGNLGIAYLGLDDLARATSYFEQAIEVTRQIGSRSMEAYQLGNMGLVYHRLGELPSSIDCQEKALSISREIGDRRLESSSLCNLGIVASSMGDSEKAILKFKQALEISRSIGDRFGEIAILQCMSNAYENLGVNNEASELRSSGVSIAQKIGARHYESRLLLDQGRQYRELGQLNEAIESIERAYTISRELENHYEVAMAAAELSRVFRLQEQHGRAVELAKEAVVLFRDTGHPREQLNCLRLVGSLFKNDIGDHRYASAYFREALAICREAGFVEDIPGILISLAECCYRMREVSDSIKYLEEGERFAAGCGDLNNQKRAMFGLAEVYFEVQQFDKAIQFYKKTREICVRTGSVEQVADMDQRILNAEAAQHARKSSVQPSELEVEVAMLLPVAMVSFMMGGELAVREILHKAPPEVVDEVIVRLRQIAGEDPGGTS